MAGEVDRDGVLGLRPLQPCQGRRGASGHVGARREAVQGRQEIRLGGVPIEQGHHLDALEGVELRRLRPGLVRERDGIGLRVLQVELRIGVLVDAEREHVRHALPRRVPRCR